MCLYIHTYTHLEDYDNHEYFSSQLFVASVFGPLGEKFVSTIKSEIKLA